MTFIPQGPQGHVGNTAALVAGNRLEPRPRSREFNRSLRAEIRDPAWLLARQWQLKEFRAEDGGKPATATLTVETARLHQLSVSAQPAAAPEPYGRKQPLDALVQARPVPVDAGLRLRLGRHWLQQLRRAGLAAYAPAYATGVRLALPEAPPPASAAAALADTLADAADFVRAAQDRIPDGYALYELAASPAAVAALAPGATAGEQATLATLAGRFRDWVDRQYLTGGQAWAVDALEHRFAMAAPTSGNEPLVFSGAGYAGGPLTWYGTDRASAAEQETGGFTNTTEEGLLVEQTTTFVPTEIQFAGSPNARWWAFEDGKTDLGQLQGDSSDFGRMLLQEFVFLYQNDWFTIPVTLPTGAVATVTGLTVTDVFGQQFRLDPAGRATQPEPKPLQQPAPPLEDDWGRWSLFAHTVAGERRASDPQLLLPPVSQAAQVGPALEQVTFLREEATNVVWAVEQTLPDGLGRGLNATDAAHRVREYLRRQAATGPTPDARTAEAFQLRQPVPENWIPVLPRPLSADPAAGFVLEQGVLPRQVDGLALDAAEDYVQPRTPLLQLVLPTEPYLVQERQVPGTGLRVDGRFRRARWHDGRTVVWYGYERGVKQLGGGSGLAFDQLVPQQLPAEAELPLTTYPDSAARTHVGQWPFFHHAATSNGTGRFVNHGQPGDESVYFTEQHTFAQPVHLAVWVCPDGYDWGYFNVYVDDELRTAGHNYSPLPGIHPAEMRAAVTMPAGTHTIRIAYTGGHSLYADQLVYTAHTPVAPAYTAQALVHAERVTAAGGEGLDMAAVDAAYRALLAGDALPALLTWTDPAFGYLRSGDHVVRLFSLSGAAGDAVPMAGSNGPKLAARSFHRYRPELIYDGLNTRLHVPDLALGATGEYAIVSLSQSPGDGLSVHYSMPFNDSSGFMAYVIYGYPRFSHTLNYTGTEGYLPDSSSGNASNYRGTPLRAALRYQADRTTPAEVIVRSLGTPTYVYSINNVRGPFSTVAPLVLGGRLTDAAADVRVNTFCLLTTENAAAVDLIDAFVKQHYAMAY